MAGSKKASATYLNKVLRSLRASVTRANVSNANVLKQIKKVKTAAKAVRRSVGARF